MIVHLRTLLVITASSFLVPGCLLPDLVVEEDTAQDDGSGGGMAGAPGVCSDDDQQTLACGHNGRGEQAQVCTDGEWVDDGECIDSDECVDDETREELTDACAEGGVGPQPQLCVEGQWQNDGECGCAEGEFDAELGKCVTCEAGEVRSVSTESCEEEGTALLQPQVCDDGAWRDEGACACAEGEEFDETASSCVVPLPCDAKERPFGGGLGTEASPFQICHIAHLNEVAENHSAHFVLAKSLGVTSGYFATTKDAEPFTGVFDGARRALVGLVVDDDAAASVGLFRQIGDGGVARDLKLINFDLKGEGNLGALAGELHGGIVERVSVVDGLVKKDAAEEVWHAGLLIGLSVDGTISDSRASGEVSGSGDLGGLIGTVQGGSVTGSSAVAKVTGEGARTVGGLLSYARDATISDCRAEGTLTADAIAVNGAAGLVGRVRSAIIADSHANVEVTGAAACVGGLAGYVWGTSSIEGCTAKGAVESSSEEVGGLVGYAGGSEVTITDCAATGTVAGLSDVGGLVGRQANATIGVSHASGDVKGTADVGGLVGKATGDRAAVSECSATGNVVGTGGSIGGLLGHSSGTVSKSTAEGTVEGAGPRVGGLVGHQEGSGASITECSASGQVTGQDESTGGLLGRNTSGKVHKSSASGDVVGTDDVGGLVGAQVGTAPSITECRATGKVDGGSDNTGGLVGQLVSGEVKNSSASGDVTGDSNIGALVGYAPKPTEGPLPTISECSAQGAVSGSGVSIGGLVGGHHGIIEASWASGDVTATSSDGVGGLVGWVATVGSIANSWASGSVSVTGTCLDVGGLVGRVREQSKVTNSYSLGVVSWESGEDGTTPPDGMGSLLGEQQATATVASCYALEDDSLPLVGEALGTPTSSKELPRSAFADDSNFSAWNLTGIWIMSESEERPLLRWQE